MDNMSMDHDHDHGGGMDDMACPMIMSLHSGNCEVILWNSWTVRSVGMFFLSTVLLFLVSVAYESLKYYREKLYFVVAQAETAEIVKQLAAASANGDGAASQCCNKNSVMNKTIRQRLFNRAHVIQTALHFIQITISYLLMLIVMTYNYWLIFAIVFGATVGYFCFGWIKQQTVDFEHCH